MALIEVRNVSKICHLGGDAIRALDDVSMDICEGEFISIIGPSGSGKSTLMHLPGCLDSHAGETIPQLFYKLSEEGRTIPLVTHDPEIAAFTPRRIQIRDGKIAKNVDSRLAGFGTSPRFSIPSPNPTQQPS